ncbi:MAG: hypothetical protein AABW65_00245 [Nanoarchaeota archaeon]
MVGTSEQKRKQIEKEAREILRKFSSALGKVKISDKKKKKLSGGYREEGEGTREDKDFRMRMFENAPEKYGDSIIAEKKEW